MFRRKKKFFKKVEVKHIPLPILIRQVIYDSMLEPAEGIAEAMGLPPISQEVSEMEERASQERLQAFSSLLPFIDSHSDIASKIATSAYVLEEGNETVELTSSLLPEDIENLHRTFKLVALSSSLSCISTLFSLGLIDSKAVKHDDN
jgi:hypothetical protein